MTNKEIYRANCPLDAPIFHQPFWLDATAGDHWDVALVLKDSRIVGSMPYAFNGSAGKRNIKLPDLTQFLGPHFKAPENTRQSKRYAHEMAIIEELAGQLPKFRSFYQQWNYQYDNWLPFFWRGFAQTTRYTYFIPSGKSQADIWSDFKDSIRTDIKKAEKKVTIAEEYNPRLLYALVEKVFAKQNGQVPYTLNFFLRVCEALKNHDSASILFAKDIDNPNLVHAGGLFIWDSETMYYLVSGIDSSIKNSGAMTYIIWNAIQKAVLMNRNFDFEGSMLPKVEPFVRNFGGERKSYYAISKASPFRSAFQNIKLGVKELLNYGQAKTS